MRVFLHTGAGKTGTSAIQVALAKLRPALAEANLCYPTGFANSDARAGQGKISSGNAAMLGPWLNPNHRRPTYDKSAIDRWLQACIAEAAGRDLLFSSEMMQFPRPEQAAELCAVFAAAGYQPTIVFYVRHALDQAVATYLQHLKRGFVGMPHRESISSMGDFLRLHRCTFLASIMPFAKILPPEQIVVRLYEDEAAALVPRFLRLVTGRDIAVPAMPRIVNRSPTLTEQEVFAALGRLSNGPHLCQLASDLILNREAAKEPLRVSPADLAAFTARNQHVVDEINARFLGGTAKLRIRSDKIEIGDVPRPDSDRVYAAFAESFSLLAAELRTGRGAVASAHTQ